MKDTVFISTAGLWNKMNKWIKKNLLILFFLRSSHGFADTDMATMIKQLKKEEEDLCGYRGLLPGTYQQTFIMGVPSKLRMYYNKLMTTTLNTSFQTEVSPREDRKFSQVDTIVKTYHNINKFLCAYLEHVIMNTSGKLFFREYSLSLVANFPKIWITYRFLGV